MSQLGKLEEDRGEFTNKGAQVIAIAVQEQAGAARSVEVSKATFPILADADHSVTSQYGVFAILPASSGGKGKAGPAVFIISQDGRIHWAYVAKGPSDRPSNQTILDNLP